MPADDQLLLGTFEVERETAGHVLDVVDANAVPDPPKHPFPDRGPRRLRDVDEKNSLRLRKRLFQLLDLRRQEFDRKQEFAEGLRAAFEVGQIAQYHADRLGLAQQKQPVAPGNGIDRERLHVVGGNRPPLIHQPKVVVRDLIDVLHRTPIGVAVGEALTEEDIEQIIKNVVDGRRRIQRHETRAVLSRANGGDPARTTAPSNMWLRPIYNSTPPFYAKFIAGMRCGRQGAYRTLHE